MCRKRSARFLLLLTLATGTIVAGSSSNPAHALPNIFANADAIQPAKAKDHSGKRAQAALLGIGLPDPLDKGCGMLGGIEEVVEDACKVVKDIGTGRPDKALEDVGVGNPVGKAKDLAKDLVNDVTGGLANQAADAVMGGVTSWVTNGAHWFVTKIGTVMQETTAPNVKADWFKRNYGLMAALAAVFALPLLLLSSISGLIRQDLGAVVKPLVFYLPAAAILTGAAIVVVAILVKVTDGMAAYVSQAAGADAKQFLGELGTLLLKMNGPTATLTGTQAIPLFVVFLGALMTIIGACLTWIELLIRKEGIYVALLFAPLCFVGMIFPKFAVWAKRLAEILLVLILSKFIIVAIFALGAAGLGSAASEDGLAAFGSVLGGAALLLLACASPFVLFRLIPIAEGALATDGHRAALGSAASPLDIPQMAKSTAFSQGMSTFTSNAGGGSSQSGITTATTGDAASASSPTPLDGGIASNLAGNNTAGASAGQAKIGASAGGGGTMLAAEAVKAVGDKAKSTAHETLEVGSGGQAGASAEQGQPREGAAPMAPTYGGGPSQNGNRPGHTDQHGPSETPLSPANQGSKERSQLQPGSQAPLAGSSALNARGPSGDIGQMGSQPSIPNPGSASPSSPVSPPPSASPSGSRPQPAATYSQVDGPSTAGALPATEPSQSPNPEAPPLNAPAPQSGLDRQRQAGDDGHV